MNVGTIVETDTIKVRLKGGGVLGEIEDYFVQGLSIGDSFIFAGRVLEFAGMKANQVLARPDKLKNRKCLPMLVAAFPYRRPCANCQTITK